MKQRTINTITSSLMNDENTSDEELTNCFIEWFSFTKEEAEFYVAQRWGAKGAMIDWQNFKLKLFKP